MPNQDRTEEPTPRRREQARQRGQVVRSREIGSAAVLLCSLVVLALRGSQMRQELVRLVQVSLNDLPARPLDPRGVLHLAFRAGLTVALVTGPILVGALFTGIAAGLGQVGILSTLEPLVPRWDRLSPSQGLKRLFSMRSLAECTRTFLKLGIVGWVACAAYRRDLPKLLGLMNASPEEATRTVAALVLQLALKVALLCALIAALDYLYQRREHQRGMRMTRQEVRDEHRQNEGDPRLRSRRREQMRRMARGRSMRRVPEATAVLTNPTHFAVAFRWDEGSMVAPRVVAKGAGAVAVRIREEARRHGIPVLSRPTLARALFRQVRIDQDIPISLYDAMAEVVVYLQGLKES